MPVFKLRFGLDGFQSKPVPMPIEGDFIPFPPFRGDLFSG
jgi:hypothetical protein